MRYIWALIWGLLLSNMVFYVLASMQGGEYHFSTASLFGIVFAVIVFILGDGMIGSDSSADQH
ncbi:YjzD family protein [Pseudalkalibacillus caeni]|uniref:DUF2929 family protein n=1 Tax=Exobacillus caeni TaxID=2574798 RepID=A0A5R9FAD6_9BACL|nr:YjzD family protein [Pseudalkalibacillus caeni]TLS37823.1 DUF2929 family protein [Pseudalkalibacillus caeni]